MNILHYVLVRGLVFGLFLSATLVSGAERKVEVSEGEILHSGGLPGYWLERCLVVEDQGLLLGFAPSPDSSASSQTPHLNPASVGKLVPLRKNQGEWKAAPAEAVAYRVHDLVLCKDILVTVGLEPITESQNAVVLIGRQKGESRILWKRKLRTEVLEPYKASAVALSGSELLVVVNGRPAGASAVQTRGDVVLLTKMAIDGSEFWQRRIQSDDAVFVSHVGLEAGEIRMTGGARGQTFERWSGLKPKMARTWGFEAGFSPENGQATTFSQVVATETASVRRFVRFPEGGPTLIGGNFSGTLQNVVPAVTNVGKGSTAFLVASLADGRLRHPVLNPVDEERLADLVMVKGRCYALFALIESGVPGQGVPRLSARRLILRAYAPDGKLVGEREVASSQLGWFKGGLTLVEHEKGLVVAFNSEAPCQVLGQHFPIRPMAENFFVLCIPTF